MIKITNCIINIICPIFVTFQVEYINFVIVKILSNLVIFFFLLIIIYKLYCR